MKFILLLLPVLAFSADYSFKNQSALSMVRIGGNSDVETYNLKTDTTGTKDRSSLGFGGHYTLGTSAVNGSDEVETARNWDVNLKYGFQQTKMFGYYAAIQYEGDKFAGYDQRNNYDAGFKYILANSDKVKSHFELGYRFTQEMLADSKDENGVLLSRGTDADFQKARLFYTYGRKVSETVQFAFWTEFIPNFDEEQDYLINFEPSVSVALDKTFSLKVAYRGAYDGQPNVAGNKRLDYTQTTSLIANF